MRITQLPPRLRSRITIDSNKCWLLPPGGHSQGYGRFTYEGVRWLAHRLTYTLLVGPIPADTELDHTCRVRLCCNPRHLEPVTHAENVRRGVSPAAVVNRLGVCKSGQHKMEGDNIQIVRRSSGRIERWCRTCKNARRRQAA